MRAVSSPILYRIGEELTLAASLFFYENERRGTVGTGDQGGLQELQDY